MPIIGTSVGGPVDGLLQPAAIAARLWGMSLAEALGRMGGTATRRALLRAAPRKDLEAGLAAGAIVRVARDRYALPGVTEAQRAAHRLTGVLVRRSACMEHGWELKTTPRRPEIAVPKNRKVSTDRRKGVSLHRADLASKDVDGHVTAKHRTLEDCLRNLPFDEALAIADSALRHGYSPLELRRLGAGARGPGSDQMRRVAREANGLAANPFESVARSIGLAVGGLDLRPQVSIYEPTFLGRPDLVDQRLRVVVECESFEFHAGRDAFDRDVRRYTRLIAHGWLVLRFTYDDVMNHPVYVREILEVVVGERTEQLCISCGAA